MFNHWFVYQFSCFLVCWGRGKGGLGFWKGGFWERLSPTTLICRGIRVSYSCKILSHGISYLKSQEATERHFKLGSTPKKYQAKPPRNLWFLLARPQGRSLHFLWLPQRLSQRHLGCALCDPRAPGRLPCGAGEHEALLGPKSGGMLRVEREKMKMKA